MAIPYTGESRHSPGSVRALEGSVHPYVLWPLCSVGSRHPRIALCTPGSIHAPETLCTPRPLCALRGSQHPKACPCIQSHSMNHKVHPCSGTVRGCPVLWGVPAPQNCSMHPTVRPCTGRLYTPCGRFVFWGVPAPQSHSVCAGGSWIPVHALGSSVHFTATPCTVGSRDPRACPCNPELLHALGRSVHPVAALSFVESRHPGVAPCSSRPLRALRAPAPQSPSLRPEPLRAARDPSVPLGLRAPCGRSVH